MNSQLAPLVIDKDGRPKPPKFREYANDSGNGYRHHSFYGKRFKIVLNFNKRMVTISERAGFGSWRVVDFWRVRQ